MSETRIFTYRTRLAMDPAAEAALSAYADLYGRAERTLFARMSQPGFDLNAAKRGLLQEFGLTARQFNAIRVGLEGKIRSIKVRRAGLIEELANRIARAGKLVEKLATRLADLRNPQAAFKAGRTLRVMLPQVQAEAIAKIRFKLHQKKRRLGTLKQRLRQMSEDEAAGKVRLCLGSRRLFRAQFDLAANGYADSDDWRADWRNARSSQLFVLGSGDETAGCQGCVATVRAPASGWPAEVRFDLQVRLPGALKEHGKHLELKDLRFGYGSEPILAALASGRKVKRKSKSGRETVVRIGAPISYRFVRDAKGWTVFVSTQVQAPRQVTSELAGAIGIDINADHIAVSETDRFGNWIDSARLDIPLHGARPDQARAWICEAARLIAAKAQACGKPAVHEKLDFAKKKAELEGTSGAVARRLSSFAYRQVINAIDAACFKAGVETIEINPAYTSVIGAVNHAQRLGISAHQGAALAIARRGLGLSEKPMAAAKQTNSIFTLKPSKRQAKVAVPQGTVTVPVRHGDHVTLALPERNRARHVWSQWSAVRTVYRAALAARSRSDVPKGTPAPLRPSNPALGAHRELPVRSRHASRQHCSADESVDVSF